MIEFQKGYDITTVGVELRKFKPREQTHWLLFKWYIAIQLCLTLILVILPALVKYAEIVEGRKTTTDMDNVLAFRYWVFLSACCILLVLFVVTVALFLYTGYFYHRAEFNDHIGVFLFQIFGLSVALAIVLLTTSEQYNPDNDVNEDIFVSPKYLFMQICQLLAFFVFLISKYPKDFFKSFSKMQNIKYSIFQKKRYIYADQFILLRRNAYLLELLKQRDKTGKQLIDLDIDDYLDPKRTLESYELGIDMAFMVSRVGGVYAITESDDVAETEFDPDLYSDSLMEDENLQFTPPKK